MSYRGEAAQFEAEVELEAERLIRDGYAAPFDAIRLAREAVMRRRQRAAGVRPSEWRGEKGPMNGPYPETGKVW